MPTRPAVSMVWPYSHQAASVISTMPSPDHTA